MSNKSSGKPNQGMKKFADMVASAAEAARQKKALEDQDGALENGQSLIEPRDLPMPQIQQMSDECFNWMWDTGVGHVHAKYDRATGEWVCGLATGESQIFEMTPDQARSLGEALLASFAYQFQWKQHFADFLLGEKVDTPELKVVEPRYSKEDFQNTPIVEIDENGEPA